VTTLSVKEAGRGTAGLLCLIGLATAIAYVVVFRTNPPSGYHEPPNCGLVELIGGTGGLGLLAGVVVLAWKRVRTGALSGAFTAFMVALTAITSVTALPAELPQRGHYRQQLSPRGPGSRSGHRRSALPGGQSRFGRAKP